MKELDIHMMQQLHKRVHIIPVIGKADSITKDELEVFKKSVAITLQQNGIETYKPFSLDAEEKYTTRHGFVPVHSLSVLQLCLNWTRPTHGAHSLSSCAPRLSLPPAL